MNCRSAEHLFSSFIEDELSQKERGSLESHLAECRRCSAAVEELRATVELVAALPSYEPGPHFEEELMDRIRSGEALRPTIVEWMSEWLAPARLRPVFLAGAAGCAAWIAFLVVNPAQHANPIVAGPAPSTTASAPSSDGGERDDRGGTPAGAFPVRRRRAVSHRVLRNGIGLGPRGRSVSGRVHPGSVLFEPHQRLGSDLDRTRHGPSLR